MKKYRTAEVAAMVGLHPNTIILGLLYGTKPAVDGAEYTFMEQSFGALCTISICAGGLMGLPLVISEYRERKILKRFQVTPVSPIMLLLVELTIYIFYCLVSMIILILVSKLWKVTIHGSWVLYLGSWLLTMLSTLSIGLMVGGIVKNSKSASVIACLLYFPMLIFSGTTLPFEVMPETMQRIISVFPMTQGVQLMKATFLGLSVNNTRIPVMVMIAVTIICTGVAVKCFKWE